MTMEDAASSLKSAPKAADVRLTDVVAVHWSQDRQMVERARAAVDTLIADEGLNKEGRLRALAKLDHFHGGGIETTETLRKLMNIPAKPGLRGLDIGSGMGGPMRWFALQVPAHMDGVDVTPGLVSIAREISERIRMDKQCFHGAGDALRIPSEDGQYDFATMMAVSCNIPDRAGLYRSIHRVLRPGGVVGMLDIVKGPVEGLVLPVPWSRDGSETTSKLLTPRETIHEANDAELMFVTQQDVSPEVLAWFRNEQKELAQGRPVGFETVVPDWKDMVDSQVKNLAEQHIGFYCMVFSKPIDKDM